MLSIVRTLEMMKLEFQQEERGEERRKIGSRCKRITKTPDKSGVKKLNEETVLKGI